MYHHGQGTIASTCARARRPTNHAHAQPTRSSGTGPLTPPPKSVILCSTQILTHRRPQHRTLRRQIPKWPHRLLCARIGDKPATLSSELPWQNFARTRRRRARTTHAQTHGHRSRDAASHLGGPTSTHDAGRTPQERNLWSSRETGWSRAPRTRDRRDGQGLCWTRGVLYLRVAFLRKWF